MSIQKLIENRFHKLESVVEKSRLRVPLYLVTILLCVGFFVEPTLFAPTYFIFFLGLLTFFETVHPSGYTVTYFKPFTPKSLSNKGQTRLLIFFKFIFISLGLFLMFLGAAIHLSGWL
ncbi:hypothetical protein H1D32_23050 [Anaerobacillus sp. CMMVII]|uniref:hypothetical protein n=1 Tax=Anaerobacillus sp. CMMVII TaxID=2755588 RepID=UPI0021B7B90F|nr:hypothetical protein [Anaerobacillus sp. CMMVII]MCT8140322.1 hypothetical protein [Anaerobacillus sp. CMMVII]